MPPLSGLNIGLLIAGALAVFGFLNWDEIKAKLPASIGGGVSLDKLSGDLSSTLTKVQKATMLSYAGRSSLSDVMIFMEKPIGLYPDGPEKVAAEAARETLYNFFGKSPASGGGSPANSTVT